MIGPILYVVSAIISGAIFSVVNIPYHWMFPIPGLIFGLAMVLIYHNELSSLKNKSLAIIWSGFSSFIAFFVFYWFQYFLVLFCLGGGPLCENKLPLDIVMGISGFVGALMLLLGINKLIAGYIRNKFIISLIAGLVTFIIAFSEISEKITYYNKSVIHNDYFLIIFIWQVLVGLLIYQRFQENNKLTSENT